MSRNLAVLNGLFPVLLIGLIFYYSASTSAGEGWFKKLSRFIGLLAATIPLVGFIELAVFRETDYEYGVACGKVTGVTLLWWGLSKLLPVLR